MTTNNFLKITEGRKKTIYYFRDWYMINTVIRALKTQIETRRSKSDIERILPSIFLLSDDEQKRERD